MERDTPPHVNDSNSTGEKPTHYEDMENLVKKMHLLLVEFNTFSGSHEALKDLGSTVRNMEQGVKDTLMRLDDMEQTNKVMLSKLTIMEHVKANQSNDSAPIQTPRREHLPKSSQDPNSSYSQNKRRQPHNRYPDSSSQHPTSLKKKQPISLSNISSVILDVSDDDLDIQEAQEVNLESKSHSVDAVQKKGPGKIPLTRPKADRDNKVWAEIERVPSKFQKSLKNRTRSPMIGRKMPFKPTQVTEKRFTKEEPSKKTPTSLEDSQHFDDTSSEYDLNSIIEHYAPQSCTPFGATMPKFIKTKFAPTVEMNLNSNEVKLCAYIFHPENDVSEILFKIDDIVATRKDFDCMAPPNKVQEEVIKLLAMKSTWWQKKSTIKTIWSLPPSFSKHVNEGSTIEDLLTNYATLWMPPYPKLKHIYVPIQEETGHWYLAVISLAEKVIYHMDPNVSPKDLEDRQRTIRVLVEVLSQMMVSSCYPPNFYPSMEDLLMWEVSEPQGQHQDPIIDSGVIIMDWIDMEHTFQPNLLPVRNEAVKRMLTVLRIIDGDHNEYIKTIEAKAEAFWNRVRY
ncbi:Ulp1 protease family, C-terminal catalytic domain [Sesbania bispinosa]|nr:Ulp1 protease family, C-terminal catalytic domain [Sesbania bispinosa]